MRPGHHWLCECGDEGDDTSCEKEFNLTIHCHIGRGGGLQGDMLVRWRTCSRDQTVAQQSDKNWKPRS